MSVGKSHVGPDVPVWASERKLTGGLVMAAQHRRKLLRTMKGKNSGPFTARPEQVAEKTRRGREIALKGRG
jgi:hypothetical protein